MSILDPKPPTVAEAKSTYFAPVAYVPAPTGIQATDTANILAAANKLPVGGAVPGGVVVLRAGQYLINAPLPDLPNVTWVGQGKTATEVRCQVGTLMTTTALREGISFEKLTLSTVAGHIFNLGIYGIANGYFRDMVMVSYNATASWFNGSGGVHFQSYKMENLALHRPATSTVPGFDVTSSAGAINANTFKHITPYGNGCTAAPAFRIEATLGAYAHDNTFENIIGENNLGGLVHIFSPNGVTFKKVVDWDSTANYVADIVKVATSATAGGKTPLGVSATNVGTRYGTLAAGVQHFSSPTVPGGVVLLDRIGDPNGTSKFPYMVGQSVRDAWGAGGSVNFLSASTTLNAITDGTVVFNGASLTATLPLPTALGVYTGRRFTIKNINATALTVNASGGANIDGAASQSLAQWAAKTYITDGAAWFSV